MPHGHTLKYQPILIVSYQQLIDRFTFLGNGADRAEDAQPLDMETVIQIVEESIKRILLARIGVGKHSFAADIPYLPAEFRQTDLVVVIEIVGHVGGAVTRLIDRLVGRIEVKEGLLTRILAGLPVVPVQNDDSLQQLMVQAKQVLFQYFRTVARAERHGELALPVYRINAVVAGTHEEDEQGGAGDVIQIPPVEECTLFHEVRPPVCMFRQGMIFSLDTLQHLD